MVQVFPIGCKPTYEGLKESWLEFTVQRQTGCKPTYEGLKGCCSCGGAVRRGALQAYL